MLCVVRTYSFFFFSSGINLDLNEEFNMIDIFERTLDIFHIVSFYPFFHECRARSEHDKTRTNCLDLNTREKSVELRRINTWIALDS